jgi:hypothetical protein
MNRHVEKSSTPTIARAILERERELHAGSAQIAEPLSAVFLALEGTVAALVGLSGYRALMRRAVHRTAPRFACLREGGPPLPRSFPCEGWTTLIGSVGSEHAQACATALLVNALELLCNVIGAELTFRLIDRAWQDLPVERDAHVVHELHVERPFSVEHTCLNHPVPKAH